MTFRLLHAPVVGSTRDLVAALRTSRPRIAVVGGSSRLGWRWRRTTGRSYATVVGRRGTAALERGCQKIDIKPDLFAAYEVTVVDGRPLAVIGIDSMHGLGRTPVDQIIELVSEIRERHPGVEFAFAGIFYTTDEHRVLIRDLFDYLNCSWLNEGDAWVAATDGLTLVDWTVNRHEVSDALGSFIEVDLAFVR